MLSQVTPRLTAGAQSCAGGPKTLSPWASLFLGDVFEAGCLPDAKTGSRFSNGCSRARQVATVGRELYARHEYGSRWDVVLKTHQFLPGFDVPEDDSGPAGTDQGPIV